MAAGGLAPALIFLWSLVPALMVPLVGLPVAALVAVLAAIVAGLIAPARFLVAIAVALIAGSLVISSQLVPSSGRYLPMLALSGALVIGFGRELYQGRARLRLPSLVIVVPLLAYVAWAGIAVVTSIDRSTSLLYLGGIAGSLVLTMVVVPTVAGDAAGIRSVVGGLAGVAVAVAASSLILIVAGPWNVYGQYVGLFEITEILARNVATGLIVPRATGPFSVPADMGFALAVGLVALLALRQGQPRRAIVLNDVCLVLVGTGLLVTMGRNGWLVAIAATGAYAAGTAMTGELQRAAVVVAGVFLAVFVLVTFDVLGASLRYDLATSRYGAELAALLPGASTRSTTTDEEYGVQFRGGSDLSGRPLIWRASIEAIRDRPVTGWGPGTNPQAIAPYLTGSAARYRGLLSHNTWLRTGVEVGLPGLVALLAVILASAWLMLRDLWRRPGPRSWPRLALVGLTAGIIAGEAFASFILGGLSFPSYVWMLAVGLLLARPVDVRLPVVGGRA